MALGLTRGHRGVVDATLAVLVVSGVAWWLLEGYDALDATPRLMLRQASRLHAAAGLAFVYVGGTVWATHVRRAWRTGRNRAAGALTALLLVALALTGYALGYLVDESSHALVGRVHWIGGLLAVAAYLIHRVRGRMTRRPLGAAASTRARS